MLWTLIHIADIALWLVMAGSAGYILFFALVSLWRSKDATPLPGGDAEPSTFLVLFPAYGEDNVIVDSVRSFLEQHYPVARYHLAVVSDHMSDDTNRQLAALPVTLLLPAFSESSKAKALQHAMQHFGEGAFDYAVVLDADNVVDADFLLRLDAACRQGHRAIQCHRCAKNSNSDIAVLDGVSEEINNTLFRRAHNRVGLSSALIGSGMCFDYRWFRDHVGLLSTAGEDRELEALLLRQRIHIHYQDDIHVYDEKVSSRDNFQRQRLRWMTAQVQSLLRMLPYVPYALRTRNIDYVDKTIQQALIPRSMLVVLSLVMAVGATLLVPVWCLKWWLLFAAVCAALFLATPRPLRSRSVFGRLAAMPALVWSMLLNLLRIDRKDTRFIHTTHDNA